MNLLPIPVNEKERLNALHNYQILDSLNEYEFDRITELASLICDTPISLVSLIDEDRQWFKSAQGLNTRQTPRELAFCAHAIMDTELFEVEDATTDARFKNNELVTGNPNIKFYAGYPLIDPDGYALGTLCVIDRAPKALTNKQKRSLFLLAQEVTALIVERRAKEELRNFEKLFQLSNDLIFIGGTDGFFKRVNPAFTKILGWDKEYLLTTPSIEFIHPDDVESTREQMARLETGENTVNFLQRFKTSDGDYKTIQWTSTPESGFIFGIGRDISELNLKRQQLAISEEKLRIFFENSQGLMCTHDLDGRFLSVNAAGAAILGYDVEEIKKLRLFDIVPEERHLLLKAYLAEIENEGHASGQMVTRHKDGTNRIWIYNNTLQNDAGGVPYVIGNGADITKRHNLERDLKRTSQMLEQTNQMARVGGWEYDIKKNSLFWTSVTKEIHGVPPDYEPDLDANVNFYKAGESREKIKEALQVAFNKGTPFDLELQIVNAYGEDVWVRTIGNAEFEDGKCVRMSGAFQDIDSYKRNEEALKQSIDVQERLNQELFEHIDLIEQQDKTIEKIKEFKFLADSIPQMIWTSKPDGSLDYCNQHWYDYTGMSLNDTMKYGWAPVLHPDDRENDIKTWKDSLASGKPYESEIRFKRISDGVYKWHLGRALPMKDEKGKITKWFGSCTDIDEYKRALDLENKISQFEDFNRIVAHNLRGPAGSIQTMLEMIMESDSESEKAEYLRLLKKSSTTLIETLNELMKVLEVRNNKDLNYDNCDLQQIVSSAESMLQGQILAKKATIATDFKTASMQFPKMYLESIFYNMISNALKYSKADVRPVITITSKTENGRVVIAFADNGLGIDLVKHKEKIFKLHGIFHTGFDSKGVGLFMTKTQIETFGGQISVESEPNVGTTFTIVF